MAFTQGQYHRECSKYLYIDKSLKITNLSRPYGVTKSQWVRQIDMTHDAINTNLVYLDAEHLSDLTYTWYIQEWLVHITKNFTQSNHNIPQHKHVFCEFKIFIHVVVFGPKSFIDHNSNMMEI